MIDDPYKVLELSPDASQDEIKKSYRRMAKQYHPDLHPNDPKATQKMNEINEAYDMLTNPDKYAAKCAQQSRQQQSSASYGQQTRQQGYDPYHGPGGWASDYDFGDIFGFGFGETQQASTNPQPQTGDSDEILRAVQAINTNRCQEAIQILTNIPSAKRNARWHYLSSLANHKLGNSVQAVEQMQKAAQMDPNNRTYVQLLQQFRRAGQAYEQNAHGFDMHALDMRKLCFGLCLAQFFCNPYSFMTCLRC